MDYTYTALAKIRVYDDEKIYTYYALYAQVKDYNEAMTKVTKDFGGNDTVSIAITLLDNSPLITPECAKMLLRNEDMVTTESANDFDITKDFI